MIDVIAAIGREAQAVAGLQVGRARLGVLAREPPDADYRAPRADHQHQRHLQQNFEGIGDARRSAIDEALGAIAGLQNELAPHGGFSELVAQTQDLPTRDQGRKRTQLGQHPLQFSGIGVLGLLQGRLLPPGVG